MTAQEPMWRDPIEPGMIVTGPRKGTLYRVHMIRSDGVEVYGGTKVRGWHTFVVEDLAPANAKQRRRWAEIDALEAPLRAAIRPRKSLRR